MEEIAAYFSLSPYMLAKENALTAPLWAGQILRIPEKGGNAYFVREGDTKELLCGSEESYEARNGTSLFFIGMRVIV